VTIKLRKNKTNKRGEAPLVLQIVHNRKSTELTLQRYIEPLQWDPDKERVLGSDDRIDALNVHLRNKRRDCQEIIDRWIAQRKSFSLHDIVQAYKGKNYNAKKSIVEFTKELIRDIRRISVLLPY